VFYYTSKLWKGTKEYKYSIIGNGPFFIEYKTGDIYQFGTALDLKENIKEYKKGFLLAITKGYFK